MKTVNNHIRERLLAFAGVYSPRKLPSLDLLAKSEWSVEFEKLCRKYMIQGAFGYGRLGEEGKPQYDRIAAIIHRAKLYKETGNDEYLVDIANFCQLEFVEGIHPKKHFKMDTNPRKVKKDG